MNKGKLKLLLTAVVLAGIACFAGMSLSREPNRVEAARSEKSRVIRNLAKQAGLTYPIRKIYIRAFKEEKELEVWGSDAAEGPYSFIRTYKVAAASGGLGPKRYQGDRQVPEGFYVIDRFNPESNFHLSLGLNYPNASDKILSDKENPGTDIFIHGNQVSIGCLAMTDDKIKEIYLLAFDAKNNGPIPVHIFPARLSELKLRALAEVAAAGAAEAEVVAVGHYWTMLLRLEYYVISREELEDRARGAGISVSSAARVQADCP